MFEDFYLNVELCSETAKIPTRANKGDSGLDLYTPEAFEILPNSDKLICLDIRVEFPMGYSMIIKEKSGIATKKKLDIGACVIDAQYRGLVHVHLFNNDPMGLVSFKAGEKIAQAIIVPVWDGTPMEVDKIHRLTDRGENGFGSTGN